MFYGRWKLLYHLNTSVREVIIIIIIIVTTKTKTHTYHAIVKSTVKYAAETGCLKAKTIAKLNSMQMDFWGRSARISRKDRIRNNIIK